MKRLQLPKNKLLKLLINVFLVLGCMFGMAILKKPMDSIVFNFVQSNDIGDWSFYRNLSEWVFQIISIIPIILVTRYVWFGRILPRPRITRSKD